MYVPGLQAGTQAYLKGECSKEKAESRHQIYKKVLFIKNVFLITDLYSTSVIQTNCKEDKDTMYRVVLKTGI